MIRTVALLAVWMALMSVPAIAQPGSPAVVRIETGALAGVRTDRASVFKNIPYAAPPVGALRWRPPQPAASWTGTRPALEQGVSCPQPMNADGTPNLGAANGPMSEDCLQLNVYAPPAAKAAPVMVWLHGGGHFTGAGWLYDGSSFARDGVVVVTINYRLGALGYFAHPALTKAGPAAEPVGNYGLMDQIAALKWVQRNIAAFGGDPGNVTVFGESAGGSSVLALLATPSATGLYAKAIVESGGGWGRPQTLADKERAGVALLTPLDIPATASAETLRAIPADKLAALVGDYGPFVDGKLMTVAPARALATGQAADVPLIIGSNSGEDSLMGAGLGIPNPDIASLSAGVRAAYAEEAAAGDKALGQALFNDIAMGGPARWVAAKASGGKPAWLYYFSYVGSRFRPAVTRAFHAAEVQYVWDYWGRRTPLSAVSAEDQAMAARMHGCWVAFAKTGVPACGPTAWPAYDPGRDQLMEFGQASGVLTQFRKAKLDSLEIAGGLRSPPGRAP